MPPKRRTASARAATAHPAAPPVQRRSAFARSHNISAAQESSIQEAFSLFAVLAPAFEDEEAGVLRRADVRRCLIALNLHPESSSLPEILETLDPTETGFVPLEPFAAYAALMLNAVDDAASSGNEEDGEYGRGEEEEDEPVRGMKRRKNKGKGKAVEGRDEAEVDAAFALFTRGDPGKAITIAHLRRVARELREEVSDDVLRDMIVEANGGIADIGEEQKRKDVVKQGVNRDAFGDVMRRAGVFG